MVVKSWILPSPILTKDVAPTPIHPPKKLTSSQVLFKSGPGFHKLVQHATLFRFAQVARKYKRI
jgi:hypothetical protein